MAKTFAEFQNAISGIEPECRRLDDEYNELALYEIDSKYYVYFEKYEDSFIVTSNKWDAICYLVELGIVYSSDFNFKPGVDFKPENLE